MVGASKVLHGTVWIMFGMAWYGRGVQAHPGPVGQNSNRGENYPRTARHTLLAEKKEKKGVNCNNPSTG